MFYLTMHSTHFYLRLYGIRHMVKDHSDSEKGNPLPPHRLLFTINSKGSFICTIPYRIAHTTAFVTPVMLSKDSLFGVRYLAKNCWVLPVSVDCSFVFLTLHCLKCAYCKINTIINDYVPSEIILIVAPYSL